MHLFTTFRYRHAVPAGVLLATFALCPEPLLFSNPPTNTPATTAPAAATTTSKNKPMDKPVITTPSGLKYIDLIVGTGPAVKTGDHILVNYEGKLIDGTKFDSSYDRGQPFDLRLGVSNVIKGWTEGLATMKVGGTRQLIIPPSLAYGNEGFQDVIPPNATLIFKVELVSIKGD